MLFHLFLAPALLALALGAAAEPLNAGQQAVLRNARNPDDRPRFDSGRELARALAKAGNADAVPYLVELANPYLLNDFGSEYTGPATPEMEQLAIAHRHDRSLGGPLLRMLRDYRSRALFDALYADLRGPQTWELHETAKAIVRTGLPVEAELTALLPHSIAPIAQEIADFLLQRAYAPALPVLLAKLQATPPGEGRQLSRLAATVQKLDAQAGFAASVRALAAARGLPPTPPLPPPSPRIASAQQGLDAAGLEALRLRAANEDLADLVRVVRLGPPRFRMDRAALGPDKLRDFAPEHRAAVAELFAARDEQERRAEELTPDNFTYWAQFFNRTEELQSFIGRGADVNARNRSKDTPLLVAVRYSNKEAVRLLLEAGADPDLADWEGLTPLHITARSSNNHGLNPTSLEIARSLVARGAKPSTPARDGSTPLHLAAGQKFRAMVELLVASGADVNAEMMSEGLPGLTPTQLAQDQGDAETQAWLKSRGGKAPAGFAMKRAARRAAAAAMAPFFISH